MVQQYLEQLTALMEEAISEKRLDVELECKHFFSGAAVYADGKICISLTPAGLAIKLPEQSRDTLMQHEGAGQLRYFPNGPIKKDYVVLPEAMLRDMRTVRCWIRASIEYVLSLPEPERKRSR